MKSWRNNNDYVRAEGDLAGQNSFRQLVPLLPMNRTKGLRPSRLIRQLGQSRRTAFSSRRSGPQSV